MLVLEDRVRFVETDIVIPEIYMNGQSGPAAVYLNGSND